VPAGTYGSEQFVGLGDATAGASIYYTLDGTVPTESSAKYAAPIPVASEETVRAIAAAPGYAPSGAAEAVYVVAGAPTVLVAPSSAVGSAGATLNAVVNPQGVSATYSFAYGTAKTALSASTAAANLAATSASANVSAALTGLKPNTTYYFQPVATTVGGSSTSAILSFTTQSGGNGQGRGVLRLQAAALDRDDAEPPVVAAFGRTWVAVLGTGESSESPQS